MERAKGLPPIARADARVLVLGTMLGKPSLKAQEYYANPRNAFWRIMGELFGFERERPYAERVRGLLEARVAVWDVLDSCARETSLDADIEDERPNDFAAFFAKHPRITRVCFNGATAEKLFRKHRLGGSATVTYVGLPSTSPAHATIGYAGKLATWRDGLTSRGVRRPAD